MWGVGSGLVGLQMEGSLPQSRSELAPGGGGSRTSKDPQLSKRHKLPKIKPRINTGGGSRTSAG